MGETERAAGAPAPAPAPPADDPLEAVISLAEAARLSGLAAHTLTLQAERGKLHARKVGHSWITTRYWLDDYLARHARHARRRPDPDGCGG
jgi:hypothetical protein